MSHRKPQESPRNFCWFNNSLLCVNTDVTYVGEMFTADKTDETFMHSLQINLITSVLPSPKNIDDPLPKILVQGSNRNLLLRAAPHRVMCGLF